MSYGISFILDMHASYTTSKHKRNLLQQIVFTSWVNIFHKVVYFTKSMVKLTVYFQFYLNIKFSNMSYTYVSFTAFRTYSLYNIKVKFKFVKKIYFSISTINTVNTINLFVD